MIVCITCRLRLIVSAGRPKWQVCWPRVLVVTSHWLLSVGHPNRLLVLPSLSQPVQRVVVSSRIVQGVGDREGVELRPVLAVIQQVLVQPVVARLCHFMAFLMSTLWHTYIQQIKTFAASKLSSAFWNLEVCQKDKWTTFCHCVSPANLIGYRAVFKTVLFKILMCLFGIKLKLLIWHHLNA